MDKKVIREAVEWADIIHCEEHPQERNRMAQVYADTARNWSLEKSAQALIEMYHQSLQ